jgi:hypothetical protein
VLAKTTLLSGRSYLGSPWGNEGLLGKLINIQSILSHKILDSGEGAIKEIQKNINDAMENLLMLDDYNNLSEDTQAIYKEGLGQMLLIDILLNPFVKKIIKAEEEQKGKEFTPNEIITLIEKILGLKEKKKWGK